MLHVKKLIPEAKLPVRATQGSAGYDLSAVDSRTILPGERDLVATGISLKLPEGVYGRIAPRSGLAVRNGINVGAGVIDSDYTGEIKVVIFNHDKVNPFVIKAGDRIAQLVLEKIECPKVKEISKIDETDRGAGGFGSTDHSRSPTSELQNIIC